MDQCGRCTVKGDYDMCKVTPCGKHEDWIVTHLTAQLTSAKEERDAARNNFDALVCDWKKGPIAEEYLARAEAAESALTSERKETERLREAVEAAQQVRLNIAELPLEDQQDLDHNGWLTFLRDRLDRYAALQSRQGEE